MLLVVFELPTHLLTPESLTSWSGMKPNKRIDICHPLLLDVD